MADMQIYKTFRFDSAHRLTGVPPTHKCSTMHGHGFGIEIHLKGSVDPKTGFVMDYGDLSKVWSENMNIWLWKQLKPQLPMLYKLVLKETETSGCIYKGP